MKSLLEITLPSVPQSLKGLTRDLRSKINLERFNELSSTRERIFKEIISPWDEDSLKLEIPKGETGCYSCQDCCEGCDFPHDIFYWIRIPVLSRDRDGWRKKGYLYQTDGSFTLTLIMASNHLDLGCDQNIATGYLLPETYRRLQAILIHSVRPRVNTASLHVD